MGKIKEQDIYLREIYIYIYLYIYIYIYIYIICFDVVNGVTTDRGLYFSDPCNTIKMFREKIMEYFFSFKFKKYF